MNITGPLREIILANNTAATLTGGKVFPVMAPQATEAPFVVLRVAENEPSDTKTGPSTLDMITVEAYIYAKNYDYTQRTDEALRTALDRYRGNVSINSVNFPIDGVRYLNTEDDFEADPELYRRLTKYKVRLLRTPANIPGGTPGTQSDFGIVEVTAGENVSSGRVVIVDEDKAYYFQPSDPTHAGRAYGITKTSAATNSSVTVQTVGKITDAGITAVVDQPCFVGSNGRVLTIYPGTGIVQKCGIGIAANSIQIDFSIQISQT